jgi:nucleotide-binding universal stress UspA family protein
MKHILVAVDESEASRRAALFVDGFFRGQDVSIVAVNVARSPVGWMPPAPYGGVAPWPDTAATPADDRSLLDEALAREGAKGEVVAAAQAPRDADIEVVFGETVEAILLAAEDEKADLIVVGATDKSFLQRLLGGSVPQDLAKRSPRPVLIVP